MIDFFQKYGRNYKYSQNSEEGVLEECLDRIGLVKGCAVEFGGSDGQFCSNTALLAERDWFVIFIESNPELVKRSNDHWKDNEKVITFCKWVTRDNINEVVTESVNVLSIDLDGPDYQIFMAMKAQPDIVIIEVDSCIPPTEFRFNADGAAGYLAMLELAIVKGYFLVCHTGNMVLVLNEHRELFPEIIGDGISNCDLYFNRAWMG